MFADLIIAGVIATAGAWQAPAPSPAVQPAIIRSVGERADREAGDARLHFAADLGCPRYRGGYYDDHRGYPRRCRRRHSEPYHDPRGDRYGSYEDGYEARGDRRGRYEDGYDPRGDRGRHSEYRSEPDYDHDRHRGGHDRGGSRDRLYDRDGRPYSRSRDSGDDAQPYRRGRYDSTPDERRDFDRFRDDRTPARGDYRQYYQRSSYHGYDRKKKHMTAAHTIAKTATTVAIVPQLAV